MKFNMMEVTIMKEETTAMVNAAIANLHEHYNADEFAAYQDGYEAGKKAGTFESLKDDYIIIIVIAFIMIVIRFIFIKVSLKLV